MGIFMFFKKYKYKSFNWKPKEDITRTIRKVSKLMKQFLLIFSLLFVGASQAYAQPEMKLVSSGGELHNYVLAHAQIGNVVHPDGNYRIDDDDSTLLSMDDSDVNIDLYTYESVASNGTVVGEVKISNTPTTTGINLPPVNNLHHTIQGVYNFLGTGSGSGGMAAYFGGTVSVIPQVKLKKP